ncbi:mercuric reductase [soil metagenome]
MEQYDAIIIGIGQAGNPLANTLAKNGYKTAVIERSHPGGSCINYGCTPTKIMVASAAVSHLAKNAYEVGIRVNGVETDFQQLIKRRDGIVEQWRDGIQNRMEEAENIELIMGEASFTGNNQLKIILNNSKNFREITADKIFINVGTSPRIPNNIDGLQEITYYTSKTMMDLYELPEHLVILGGSYIGLEFGQMYSRLGSKVSILQQEDQLAPREDEDIANAILEFLEDENITVILEANTKKVKKLPGGFEISYEHKGQTKNLKGTHLLLAIGTTPNTSNLNLEKTGVNQGKHGYIEVNQYLETNRKGIFALGDCKGGPEFTHISYDDYRIVNDYLFGDKKRNTKDRMVPYTLFTKPELGRIGLSEKEAKKQNINYKIATMPMNHVARAIEANKTTGFLKVLVEPNSGKILGAACLADDGGDLMAMLQIAMMGNLNYTQLRDGIFSHPTYAEAFNNLFTSLKDPE